MNQPAHAIPAMVRDVMEAPGALAFLTTINPDGSPQVTLVRPGIEGDEIVVAHMSLYQKVRNIRRDQRVVLGLIAPGGMEAGNPYLTVIGNARVTEGGAVELLQRIIAADAARDGRKPPTGMPPMQPEGGGYVTRITPVRYGGRGPWAPNAMPPGLRR
jgi:PPOX class probable F420-dependent enzyme